MAIVLAAVLATPGPADAASARCRQFQAALSNPGGPVSGPARAYDRAIAAQGGEITKMRARLQATSCGLAGDGTCSALRATLRRMQGNLASLRQKRGGMTDRRQGRAEPVASFEGNGCRGKAQEPQTMRRQAPPAQPDAADAGRTAFGPRGAARYCVRTCDGYFFPMTRTAASVEDQDACEAACPGTGMQVFLRARNAGGGGAMISAEDGRRYSELPNAFVFRDPATPRRQECGCNIAKAYRVMSAPDPIGDAELRGGGSPAPPDAAKTASTGSFSARLFGQAAEDAAQARDAARGASVEPTPREPARAAQAVLPRRKVRVVGPTFLPGLEAAGRLQAPDPTPAP